MRKFWKSIRYHAIMVIDSAIGMLIAASRPRFYSRAPGHKLRGLRGFGRDLRGLWMMPRARAPAHFRMVPILEIAVAAGFAGRWLAAVTAGVTGHHVALGYARRHAIQISRGRRDLGLRLRRPDELRLHFGVDGLWPKYPDLAGSRGCARTVASRPPLSPMSHD